MWSIRTKKNRKNKTAAQSQNPRMDSQLPKGKGLGRMGGKGGKTAGKQKAGLTFTRHNVGWGHAEGCATQRRQVVILQHLTTLMDTDCDRVCGGGLGQGGNLVNIMFFMTLWIKDNKINSKTKNSDCPLNLPVFVSQPPII